MSQAMQLGRSSTLIPLLYICSTCVLYSVYHRKTDVSFAAAILLELVLATQKVLWPPPGQLCDIPAVTLVMLSIRGSLPE